MGETKVVLDTSVIICGLIGKGNSNEILKLIFKDKLKPVISAEIFNEYVRVFYYEKLSGIRFKAMIFLDKLYDKAIVIKPKETFSICRDLADDKFINAVYASKTQCLITLDDDLLRLRDKDKRFYVKGHKFWILKPSEFIKIFC